MKKAISKLISFMMILSIMTFSAGAYAGDIIGSAGECVDKDGNVYPQHTLEFLRMVLPTYDEEGLSEGIYCSVCGKILQEQQVLDKLERPLPGDVNGDHVVDGRDVLRLMKSLSDDPEFDEGCGIYFENADVNADGEVDEKDLLRLVRYLAGEDVTLEVGYVSGNG